ncbi:probable CCR4-associated factor 1 homolog 11 [Solanum verrucosum]|uniref:probable CCR4-associated factor 1 homolog 11 n=1 Tax=Solanum verrucosum TaxID=315347 RepID=UPI0020D036F7|nr:probable CCR4-associated factor 1 homolog 11 [Solanum verrucosum]
MDTEYPDNIYNPVVPFSQLSPVEKYNLLKSNVDELKLIQVNGFGFYGSSTFLDFDRNRDQYAEASIFQLFVNSGIDFERNLELGIRSIDFDELLMSGTC